MLGEPTRRRRTPTVIPMPLDPHRLTSLSLPPRSVSYTDREAMLYALAVGLGRNGGDDGDLGFVFEASLRTVPSFATTVAFNDGWLEAGGIELAQVVHGAQHLRFAAPLPPAATVSAQTRIVGLVDKGAGRGGIVVHETTLADPATGKVFVVGRSSLFVRGGGGFGGSTGVAPESPPVPSSAPDKLIDVATTRNQALIFRLLGDRNPLHADPAVARAAGFARPILHGACTYGIACATLLRHFCDLDPARLLEIEARFAGPLHPGETLRFGTWRNGRELAFRAHAVERDAIVLDNGHAVLAA